MFNFSNMIATTLNVNFRLIFNGLIFVFFQGSLLENNLLAAKTSELE